MSAGIFAAMQPEYARHGIATFPVWIEGKDKRPAVVGYAQIGLRGSEQLTMKFGNADALGFMAGVRSKITVLDVDTSDEDVLRDATRRHGEPKIIVRSGSGNFQCWYRYAGEPRKIRPSPKLPIDILGAGYVVAPPSRGSRQPYELIRGGLEDLDNLPPLRNVDDLGVAERTMAIGDGRIKQGKRSKELLRHLMERAHEAEALDELTACAFAFAERRIDRTDGHTFTDADIRSAANWCWTKTAAGKNWIGQERRIEKLETVILRLAAKHPYANSLWDILQNQHGNQERFPLAKSRAQSIGWTLPKFRQARDVLTGEGLIVRVEEGGRGPHDPPIYTWGGLK